MRIVEFVPRRKQALKVPHAWGIYGRVTTRVTVDWRQGRAGQGGQGQGQGALPVDASRRDADQMWRDKVTGRISAAASARGSASHASRTLLLQGSPAAPQGEPTQRSGTGRYGRVSAANTPDLKRKVESRDESYQHRATWRLALRYIAA